VGRMNRSRAAAIRLPARQGVLAQVALEQPQPAIRGHLLEDKLGGQLPLDRSSQARYPPNASERSPVGGTSPLLGTHWRLFCFTSSYLFQGARCFRIEAMTRWTGGPMR
jgi:hypothetical protein